MESDKVLAHDFVRHFLWSFGERGQSVLFQPVKLYTKIAKCRSYLNLTALIRLV